MICTHALHVYIIYIYIYLCLLLYIYSVIYADSCLWVMLCHVACVPAPRRLHQEIEILLSLLLVALGGAGWFGGASYRAIDFPLGDRKMAAKWLAVANYDSFPAWLASWNALGEIYCWDLEQWKQFHAVSNSLGRIAVVTSSSCSFT